MFGFDYLNVILQVKIYHNDVFDEVSGNDMYTDN